MKTFLKNTMGTTGDPAFGERARPGRSGWRPRQPHFESATVPDIWPQSGRTISPTLVHTPNRNLNPTPRSAFTLIEILVTVALLSVIIIGLVAMFDQTRRAFNSGLGDVDMLESGRTALDMISRELEQMAPGDINGAENFWVSVAANYNAPLIQPLNTPGDFQVNTLEQLYFLTKYNLQWNAVGYKVDPNAVSTGIGTLYRYSSNNIPNFNLAGQLSNFLVTTNLSRLIDGVVNFRIRAYDRNGYLLGPVSISPPGAYQNIVSFRNPVPNNNEFFYSFTSNAIPAYLEVELGILEPRTLLRYNALTNNAAVARNYLNQHAAQVHNFRRRITIRGLDMTAYPPSAP